MTFDWKSHQKNRDFGIPANSAPMRKDEAPAHVVHVKKFYTAPRKATVLDDEMDITDKGTYVVEWASLLRDMAALFFEGVGLVLFGHFISMVAIMMIVGMSIGIFALRRKTHKKNRR